MKKDSTKKTRHGKHREELVGFAGYISPELKAIAQVTANELKVTMMDLVRDGFIYNATRAGVMENGEVVAKYKDVVDTYVELYKMAKRARKAGKENAK